MTRDGGVPTEFQQRCWDAYQEHGTFRAAALALGMKAEAVRSGVDAYRVKTGKSASAESIAAIPARLDAIEEALRGIAAAEVERTLTLARILEQVRELNARQPLLLVERYATHRRQSDGGQGGKRERSGR